jgi:hypothetical protein
MDSVMVAIFFKKTGMDHCLDKDLKSVQNVFLQQFIKINFVDKIRRKEKITMEQINIIRNMCQESGWKENENIFNQQDASEFYNFIAQVFEFPLLEIQRNTITGALPNKGDVNNGEKIPFIPLSIPLKKCMTSDSTDDQKTEHYESQKDYYFQEESTTSKVLQKTYKAALMAFDSIVNVGQNNSQDNPEIQKDNQKNTIEYVDKVDVVMFDQWMYDNVVSLRRKLNNTYENQPNFVPQKEEQVNGLSTYKITNFPPLIPFVVNRFADGKTRAHTEIDIQTKIFPFDSDSLSDLHKMHWTIHSIVCHSGHSPLSGHYYSYLYDDGKWYCFDDLQMPSVCEVKITDPIVSSEIKKQCVLIFYQLDI